jgi:putative flippase GtrA
MAFRHELKRRLVAPVEGVLLQLPRALVVSVLAAGLDFGLLVLLVETADCPPALAAVFSYLAGGVLQYVLCARWVFPAAPSNATVGFAAFTVLSLGGLAITWAAMALLYDRWGVAYPVAKVVALGLAFHWNFFSRKLLLFRPGRTPARAPAEDRPATAEAA